MKSRISVNFEDKSAIKTYLLIFWFHPNQSAHNKLIEGIAVVVFKMDK